MEVKIKINKKDGRTQLISPFKKDTTYRILEHELIKLKLELGY